MIVMIHTAVYWSSPIFTIFSVISRREREWERKREREREERKREREMMMMIGLVWVGWVESEPSVKRRAKRTALNKNPSILEHVHLYCSCY